MTFRLRHLLAALVLHALLFGLLAGGVQCTRKPERPPVIRAVLLDPDRKETAQQKKREEQRRAEQRRQAEREKLKREAETRRKAQEEQQRQAAEEAQRQRQLAEQQKKAAEAKRQKELAEQKKAEEQARKQKEQEALRERQEQARREIQEKARMEEAMRQEALRREAEREQAARTASEREVHRAAWADILERHVRKYWIRPASATGEFQCTVLVQLLPDGTVTSARVEKNCGTAALNKSVEDAVYRASPLPRPADPLVFERELIIHFEPGS